MNYDKKTYRKYAQNVSPHSKTVRNCVCAFLVGGLICTIAQGLKYLYTWIGIDEETVKILIPVTLIVIAAILTGISVFDKIAKHAGAGTLVPITGFANAVVSPAIDMKAEGFILGVGAKIFTIAGPVIVFGVLSSVIYGIVLWIVGAVGI